MNKPEPEPERIPPLELLILLLCQFSPTSMADGSWGPALEARCTATKQEIVEACENLVKRGILNMIDGRMLH